MNDVIFAFFLIIFSGVVIRIIKPAGIDPERLRQYINTLVFYLFLPALCFSVMAKTSITAEIALVPLTAIMTLSFMTIISLIIYSLFPNLSDAEKGAVILVSVFGNVTYLGLPVITGLFGSHAAQYALYYDLLATTPFLWTVGARIAARYGGKKSPSKAETIKKLFSLPPLWGILLGLIFNIISAPISTFVMKAAEMLGQVVVPLMIFSIGLSLSFIKPSHVYVLLPVCLLKLLASPLISYISGRLLGLTDITLKAVTLEGGMPSMVLSLLVATVFGLDVSLVAFAIVVSTLASFLTLPVILVFLG